VKLGVSTKAAMALLSVLGDAAIDEEPLWILFNVHSQANSARSDSRHRQTVVKRNSDHKDDPPPRLPVIVKDSNRRYRKGA
jgi:hypothetical protein